MRLQLLSDLHLETEDYEPRPAPDAELLVLAGDIDSTWAGWAGFANWPVPVLAIAGNHEFDGRELDAAWPALRAHVEGLGIRLIERERVVLTGRDGRRIRFAGTVRWCDFDLFGAVQRERAMRAAGYFQKIMRATRHGEPFGAAGLREEGLACRDWLEAELRAPNGGWDATVAITHFGPSVRSVDPRYGTQASSASFCNADDALLPLADVWLHGHLHCRFDYRAGNTRVVSNARGHSVRGEADGHDGLFTLDV